ncbi:MAG: carbohydrate binding family 9 domain-containing protein [bacterium]|nr:carbohydrate binding family 9 domain-containing protein [bacterium]
MKPSFVCWLLLVPGSLAAVAAEEGAAAAREPSSYVLETSRFATPPTIDGRMAEGEWAGAVLATDFTQLVPDEGAPASERTEVHIGYDPENLYFAVRAFDSEADKLVANMLVRDADLRYDDTIRIILDTFHDQQNGFLFATNPLGVQVDALVRQEGAEVNLDWDGIWSCAATRDPEGFTAEIAIPFKTLRFPRGPEQVWGINISRSIARKQEEDFWKPMSRAYGFYARYKISQYGELTGLREIAGARRVRFKPYAVAGWDDQNAERSGDWELEAGIDVKAHLTSDLVADLTYNTDFAEAEADAQQVNLTRFRLFFPEKRDFFLEGANLFFFGDRPEPYRGVVDNLLFFSRQIGLSRDGRYAIPVIGGAKLTGAAGDFSIGMLNLTTDELSYTDGAGRSVFEPRTNYTVLRLKRSVLEKSAIGVLGLNKDRSGGAGNRVVATDWDFAVGDHLKTGGYLAKSSTPGLEGDDWAGFADVFWDSKHTRMHLAYTDIGEIFNDELGYIPRTGIRKLRSDMNYVLWPEGDRWRQVWFTWDLDYVTNRDGDLETRVNTLQANAFFESSAGLSFKFYDNLEVLTQGFPIHRDVVIAPGTYRFRNYFFGFQTDYSKKLGGAGRLAFGDFYDGRFLQTFGAVIYRPTEGLFGALVYERTDVDLPAGRFVTDLVQSEITYAFTSQLSVRAAYQWLQDDNSLGKAILKWTYRPGSSFYVVYEQLRDLTEPEVSFTAGIPGRSILAKTVFLF